MLADRPRLILVAFLTLFVELALIRWTTSNVVYLSYFSNFVLLGSFLGIGVGFLRAGARRNMFPWAPVALAALVVFVLAFPVTIDRTGDNIIYFGEFGRTGLPIWVTLPIVFLAVAAVMAMLGEGVARTFVKFKPLEAYRLDIIGSILGIASFAAMAFTGAPPIAWGVVAAVLFVVLSWPRLRVIQMLALIVLCGVLLDESFGKGLDWSPYYKITTAKDSKKLYAPCDGGEQDTEVKVDEGEECRKVIEYAETRIHVNGIPHQSFQPTFVRRQFAPIYFIPYERAEGGRLDDVLIVGAGTGTDVAIALEQGARHVDAVEIDPKLQDIGAEQHPDKPYQDERVDVHIDDGRAFLERTDKKYDLILFALPDSLTLVAGQSAVRLESYLFTVQAMREAREHLKSGGVFAMYNYYREQWLIDRLARTLEQAYGHAPCTDVKGEGKGLAVLTVGKDEGAVDCPTPWREPSASVAPEPATDDYPFLYLKERGIPNIYLVTVLMVLLASVAMVRGVAGPLRPMARYADMFFMGAAFLLLETKNVVQFALLFGTTWFVNALVFLGILSTVLVAIEVSRRVRFKRPLLLYLWLIAALAVAWLVPQSALLELDYGLRFAAAVALAFTPIFLANLVFAERFKDVGASATAFGANLLGAMFGGVIEYSALILGYNTLLIVVALLYGLAFATGWRYLSAGNTARS